MQDVQTPALCANDGANDGAKAAPELLQPKLRKPQYHKVSIHFVQLYVSPQHTSTALDSTRVE